MGFPLAIVFVLVIIFLIVLLVSGFYVTRAAVKLKRISGYNTDSNLQAAHKNVTWGAVLTWTAVGLAVLIVIAMVFFGAETAEVSMAKMKSGNSGHFFLFFILLVCGVLGLLNGILAAVAAQDMKRSSNFNRSNYDVNAAYDACIVAAITGIGSIGLLVLIYLCYSIYVYQKKQEIKHLQQKQAELIAENIKFKRELAETKALSGPSYAAPTATNITINSSK